MGKQIHQTLLHLSRDQLHAWKGQGLILKLKNQN